MKPKKIFGGLIAVFCAFALVAFIKADDDPVKKIVTQLNKWTDSNPQEKVYLHMDKPYYAAGDDIWFKGYITIGEKHQLSGASGILNVELINDKDSVKQSIKIPVISGVTWSNLHLADTLQAGNYRVRAYTNYMRNYGDEYFFDKTITVGNAISNAIFSKATYKYSTANGQQKVDAAITYTDLNGIAFVNKEVSYEVQLGTKSVARGKGITDANGMLNVSFTVPANAGKSGCIITNIKYAEKKTNTQTVMIKAASDKVDVQFLPEGGTLINGVREKVAFKATGADGLGVDIKGIIKDNQNTDVARLSPSHYGMGYAAFSPESGKTYKAVVTMPDGSESTIALPTAVDKGYSLAIGNNDDASLIVKINASQALVDEGTNEVIVVAQQGGHVYFVAKSKVSKMVTAAAVPKNRFPSGIVQFTLFSGAGDPLCERLAFIQNPDLLKLDLKTEQTSYAPRAKVKINLSAADASDKPVVGVFSAAVVDESKVKIDDNDEQTILTNLLLTSDLKGYVEKPNYYFTNVNDDTKTNLDALMMTQGYRRFVWKDILADKFAPLPFAVEKSITISGTIKTDGGKPIAKAKVSLFSNKMRPFLIDTVADDQGRFAFKGLAVNDSTHFLVQARTPKGSKFVEIEIDKNGATSVSKNKNAPDMQVNVNAVLSDYLQYSNKLFKEQIKYGVGDHSTMLREVVISEKKATPTIQNSGNLNGAGNADQVIKAKDLESCPSLDICLTGRINFVTVRQGMAYSTRSPNNPMLIVLDGMQMSDDFTLDNIVASDVSSIEVLRTIAYTGIYGSRGGSGVLIINTKRGGEEEEAVRYAPGIVNYSPKGYYAGKVFYEPKYDDPKTNAAMADLRSTITWRPNLITDKEGHASFEFFNADAKGTYRVVVEGIDSEGNLGRQVYRYKVE